MGTVRRAAAPAQNEKAQREFHPRLVKAIEALRDARGYLAEAPHDFGGHKAEAVRATDEAIKPAVALEFASGAYSGRPIRSSYSSRRAVIGSTRDARRAGKNAATIATARSRGAITP